MITSPLPKIGVNRVMNSLLFVALFTSGLLVLALLGFPIKLVLSRYVILFVLTFVGLSCVEHIAAFLQLIVAVVLELRR